jgi:hypothetical protein
MRLPNSLKDYLRKNKIRIDYRPKDSNSKYWFSINRISIGSSKYQISRIACLLHELGHAIDFKKGLTLDSYDKTPYIYEKRAWKYARKLAKKLHITIDKLFILQEYACLKTYKSDMFDYNYFFQDVKKKLTIRN